MQKRKLGNSGLEASPLGKGFLTAKIDESTTFDRTDFRNMVPRFAPEARKANLALVESLSAIAARKNVPPRAAGTCRASATRNT
jgi:aryl-alcohol dehydrogenase-like predicted oxidoreductase